MGLGASLSEVRTTGTTWEFSLLEERLVTTGASVSKSGSAELVVGRGGGVRSDLDLAMRKRAEAEGRVDSILRWPDLWWRLEADLAFRLGFSPPAAALALMISLAVLAR